MTGLELKELRKKLKLTQSKLAELVGVDLKTIQNWEAGRTIPKTKCGILGNLQQGHIVFGGQHVQNGDAVNGDKIIENEREQQITDNAEQSTALLHALDEITEMRKLLASALSANQRTNDRLLTLLENLQNK